MVDWYKETVAPDKPKQAKPTKGVDWYAETVKDADPFKATEAYGPVGGDREQVPMGVRTVMDTADPLGFVDRFKAGMIEDPEAQRAFYASRRFPNLPPEQAAARYGSVRGETVYLDESGALRRENEGPSFTPGDTAKFLGGYVGPFVGGAVGGAMGGAPGAALGGAAGVAARKLGGLSLGDRQTSLSNAFDMAAEAVLQAAGWKLGEKIGEATVDRRVARDALSFDKKKTEQLIAAAKQYGIDLTPGEASNLGSLLSQQKRYGQSFDDAGDTVREFLRNRAEQVDEAVTGFIGSPPPAVTLGARAREVGAQAIDDARAARTAASRSAYRVATGPGVMVRAGGDAASGQTGELSQLLKDPVIADAMKVAGLDPEYGVTQAGTYSMRRMDAVKKILDDRIEAASTAAGETGRRGTLSTLTAAKQKLVGFLDKQYPVYKEARQAFETASPAVEEVASGLEGMLAGLKDTSLAGAARRVFTATDVEPRDIAALRRQFVSQGREGDWDGLLNQFLRFQWGGKATRDIQTGPNINAGANFRNAVFGTKNQKLIMREAMGPQRFAAFEKLMDVLEATGRAAGGQSWTESALAAGKAERVAAAPILGREGGIIPGARQLADWWTDLKVSDWRSTMAKVITSPDAITELEKLRVLRGMSPTNKDALRIVTSALTKAGVYGPASLVAGQQPDATPQALASEQRQPQPRSGNEMPPSRRASSKR